MAVFQGTAGADTLTGGAENDVLLGYDGNDSLNGGAGADTMFGGAGDDTYVVDNAGDVVDETTTAGADAGGVDLVQTSVNYTLGAFVENLTAATGSANLTLNGNAVAGGNVITGNAGNNVIYGGDDGATGSGANAVAATAADTLIGGAGNDTYIIREGADDVITELADDATGTTLGGNDTVLVVASQTRTSYTLNAGAVVENILASDAASTLALNLTGNEFAQTIVGNAGTNILTGGGGADTLIGLGGDDLYNVTTSTTVVVEADNGGNDAVSLAGAATGQSFIFGGSIETIDARGMAQGLTVNITGGSISQVIYGNDDGASTLTGAGGTDTFITGTGNDLVRVDSLDDVILGTAPLAAGSPAGTPLPTPTAATTGTDRVVASSSYALNASGVDFLFAAGNTLQLATGGTAATTLTGQGDGTFNLNALNTTVTSNYFVGDTASSTQIWGDAGGNILNGRTGTGAGGVADTLIGLGGNDTYRVYDQTDVVIEDTNGGAQDFIYTSVSYDLAVNDTNAAAVAINTGTIGAAATATFLTGPGQIEVLSAADQQSTTNINLSGNAYGQIIIGNYGNNAISDGGSLSGGVQYQDQLAGLRGNDTYNVTAQNTTVNENVGEGTDVVNVNLDAAGQSFFGLISAAEVEFVNATGANAISLQGNGFNQVLTGNAAANTLNGGGGQDTLVGGAGSDSYVVDSTNAANVTIIEATTAAGDTDRVVTSVSFDLAATNAAYVDSTGAPVAAAGIIGIEQIVVANGQGTEAINLTGNGAAQILVGNYGNNILNGDNDTVDANGVQTGTAAGDTLVGLFGDDTYRVYSQNDVIREIGGQGNDTVFTSGNYQLRQGNSIETLSAANQSSTVGLQLIGNEFAQAVIGTNGNDTIWGGNGNDTLTGRGGSDIFGFNEVGAGAADIITDFTPGDFIGLSNTTFAALTTNGTAGFDQNEFVLGTTAVGTNAQVIYNQATGQLFYDADGTGTGAAQLFATVTPGTALGFNDFQIIAPPPATPAAA